MYGKDDKDGTAQGGTKGASGEAEKIGGTENQQQGGVNDGNGEKVKQAGEEQGGPTEDLGSDNLGSNDSKDAVQGE